MRLTDRDFTTMKEIERWSVVLARHIRYLANFSSQRTTDRRLKILIENNFVERKKYLYGIPSLYFLTSIGKRMINASNYKDNVKLEQIQHDIYVVDTVLYFIKKYNLQLTDILSEKQMHQMDGFAVRKHRPDFVFKKGDKLHCVEVELTQKAKTRLEKNIKDNYMNYESQKWIVPSEQIKIRHYLEENAAKYEIEIINLKEVEEFVRSL